MTVPIDCPNCERPELDTEENNDALVDDEVFDYFCPSCGELYQEEELKA